MKARILFFFLVLTVNFTKAQEVMNTFLNNYFQPPPDVSSLGKYVDFPVGYYTGVPNINIPIYQLKDGAVNLPISLNYHSGGITVSELASWVGLGWSLNAGGMVMRSVRGAPDEGTNKNCGGGCYMYPRGYWLDSGLRKMRPMNFPNNDLMWGGHLNTNIAGSMGGYLDFEPDLYFFNFNGHIGRFVFDENRHPVLLSDDNIKIEVQKVFNLFVWTFTTPDGVKYFFGENNMVNQSSPITWNESGAPGPADADASVPSCWYLTRIVYPNTKDTVNFNYVTENYGYYDHAPQQAWSSMTNVCGTPGPATSVIFNNETGRRLTSITTRNYTLTFVAKNERTDLIPNLTTTSYRPYSLDSIKIYNSPGNCLKQIALGHSYFGSSLSTGLDPITLRDGMNDDVSDTRRLKLVSVCELSGDGSVKKNPYAFTYQEYVGLPRRMSFDQDHWGYCNNSSGNRNVNFFPTLEHPTCALPVPAGMNRTPRWPDMSGFIISTIKDPLGVTTAFDFEPDSGSYKNGPIQIGGGVRIHKVTVMDNVTATSKITSYDYGSSGILYHLARYLWDINNEYYQDSGKAFRGYIANPRTKYLFISSQSVVPLQDIEGNNIGYSTVKEIFGANGEGGYKVYKFQATDTLHESSRLDITNFATYSATPPPNAEHAPVVSGLYPNGHFLDILPQNLIYYTGSDVGNYFPSAPDQLSLIKGNQLSVYTYDSSNTLLNSLENTFQLTLHENDLIRGFKASENGIGDGTPTGNYDDSYTFYKLHAGISHMTSSVNTEYRNGQAMTTVTHFGYESPYHTLQTSDTTTTSMGDSLIKKSYYSFDYANNATADNVFAKINNRNLLIPVATEIWKNNQLIMDTIVQLKDFATNGTDTFINAAAIYTLNINSPLSQSQAGENIALTGKLPSLLPNSYLIPRASFAFSGISGKIQQQQLTNNKIQAIIWDNQYAFPLAQADNAAFGDIAYTSFESAETGNWALSDTTLDRTYGLTGSQSYDLTGSRTINASVTGSKQYIVSYWSKGGSIIVKSNGTVIPVNITGPNRIGWTYYEHLLPATTTLVSVSATTGTTIDELRLYPNNAQMSTCTYKPLIGMTSQCDMNNKVTYYEYDTLIRLKDIKDQDGNILKTMDYHYQGQ